MKVEFRNFKNTVVFSTSIPGYEHVMPGEVIKVDSGKNYKILQRRWDGTLRHDLTLIYIVEES